VNIRTENSNVRALAAPDDRPLVVRTARLHVEPVPVDHQVVSALRYGHVGVSAEQVVAVVHLDG
jgi:hypothetical protein